MSNDSGASNDDTKITGQLFFLFLYIIHCQTQNKSDDPVIELLNSKLDALSVYSSDSWILTSLFNESCKKDSDMCKLLSSFKDNTSHYVKIEEYIIESIANYKNSTNSKKVPVSH